MVFALRMSRRDLLRIEEQHVMYNGVRLWRNRTYSKESRASSTLSSEQYTYTFEGIYNLWLAQYITTIVSIIPGTTNYHIVSHTLKHSLLETKYEPEESKVHSSIYTGFIYIEYAIKAGVATIMEEADWENTMLIVRKLRTWGITQPTSTVI